MARLLPAIGRASPELRGRFRAAGFGAGSSSMKFSFGRLGLGSTVAKFGGYALSGEGQKARAAGCDDYVPKPFSPRQLLAKIRQYLQ
jgi:hypothetical protein